MVCKETPLASCPLDEMRQRFQTVSQSASDEAYTYLSDNLLKRGVVDNSVLYWARLATVAYIESLVGEANEVFREVDPSGRGKERAGMIVVALEQMAESNPAGVRQLLEEDFRTAVENAVSLSADDEGSSPISPEEGEAILKIDARLKVLGGSFDDLSPISLLLLGLEVKGLCRRSRKESLIRRELGEQRFRDYVRLSDLLIPLGILGYAADRLPTHIQGPLFEL